MPGFCWFIWTWSKIMIGNLRVIPSPWIWSCVWLNLSKKPWRSLHFLISKLISALDTLALLSSAYFLNRDFTCCYRPFPFALHLYKELLRPLWDMRLIVWTHIGVWNCCLSGCWSFVSCLVCWIVLSMLYFGFVVFICKVFCFAFFLFGRPINLRPSWALFGLRGGA